MTITAPDATAPPLSAGPEDQAEVPTPSRWLSFAGRHWMFLLFFTIGAAIRLITTLTYQSAFMFFGDSYAYIVAAQRFAPPNDRPFGYAALLRMFSSLGDIPLVIGVQHLIGLALAITLYVVLLKRGARPWIAALASAPLLLDAYLIQIEHSLLTESVFAALLAAAVFVATRRDQTWVSAAVAGGLLAAAASTRTVAIPIGAIFLGYFLLRRIGWRQVVAFTLALAIPILGYMTWFAATHGVFATTDASGRFLYGRVAVFANCDGVDLTRNEAKLCDNADPSLRPNANFYVWAADSPLQSLDLPGQEADKVASTFSRKVILDQPLTYARYALTDTAHYFAPGRFLTRVDSPDTPWRFPTTASNPLGSTSVAHNDLHGDPVDPVVKPEGAQFLSSYQAVVYTQGPILLGGLILGLVAGFIDRSRRRFDGPFAALVGLAVIAVPSFTVMFDYRYGLPAIPVLMYAGGIGAIAVRARMLARRAQDVDAPDDVNAAAPTEIHELPISVSTHSGRSRWWPRVAIASIAAGAVALIVVSPLQRNEAFATYVSSRAELGTLGAPLASASPDPTDDDVTVRRFVTGTIVSRDGHAVVVPARYSSAIEKFGGYGELGIPTNREHRSPYRSADRYLPLEEGVVFWSRLEGTRTITGTIFDVWNPQSVQKKLREPLGDAVRADDGVIRQEFDGGTVTVTPNGSLRIDFNDAGDDGTDRPAEVTTGDSAASAQ